MTKELSTTSGALLNLEYISNYRFEYINVETFRLRGDYNGFAFSQEVSLLGGDPMETVTADRNFCVEIAAAMAMKRDLSRAADAMRAGKEPRDWGLLRQARAAEDAEHALRQEAADAFAALNGWRRSKSYFGPWTLAQGGIHSDYSSRDGMDPRDLFDHPLRFREARPYRSVAIIGQPYSHVDLESAREVAAEMGLQLHAPPNLDASWYFPGQTRFFVFTRPGSVVRFLPEQMVAV